MNGDNFQRSVLGHKNSLPHKTSFTQGGRLETTQSSHWTLRWHYYDLDLYLASK